MRFDGQSDETRAECLESLRDTGGTFAIQTGGVADAQPPATSLTVPTGTKNPATGTTPHASALCVCPLPDPVPRENSMRRYRNKRLSRTAPLVTLGKVTTP